MLCSMQCVAESPSFEIAILFPANAIIQTSVQVRTINNYPHHIFASHPRIYMRAMSQTL